MAAMTVLRADSAADSAWARLQRAGDGRDIRCPDRYTHRAGYLACRDRVIQDNRTEGITFFNTYSNDPRRWDWLAEAMWQRPKYYFDVEDAAQQEERSTPWRAKIDTLTQRIRERPWQQQLAVMKAALFASPQATYDQKNHFAYLESYLDVFELIDGLHRGRPAKTVQAVADEILAYAAWGSESNNQGFVSPVEKFITTPIIRRTDSEAVNRVIAQLRQSKHENLLRWIDTYQDLFRRPITLHGPDLVGHGTVDVTSARDHVVVLDFWGMGCSACIEAWPNLKKLAEKYAMDSVRVIGVAADWGNHKAQLQALVSKYALPWSEIYMGSPTMEGVRQFLAAYGFEGVPGYMVLDHNGDVVEMGGMTIGEVDEAVAEALRR